MQNTERVLISVDHAAEILGKTPHSVRQFIMRGVLPRHEFKRRVMVDVNDVITYYARKRSLPSWEINSAKVKNRKFMMLDHVARELLVQPSYVIRLIRTKVLEGYVLSNGDTVVMTDSINSYLRIPDAATNDL